MRIYTKISICLSGLLLTSCAFGPLVNHETARTVGDEKHEWVAGLGMPGFVFKWNYGVTEDWDIGVHVEALSIGVRTKYAFINARDKGFALAVAGGVGESIGGSHYYGDLLASYFIDRFEPYGSFRVVRVKTDPLELRDKETGAVDFTIESWQYTYGQAILGSRFWINKNWLISVEASSLFAFTGLKVNSPLLFSAAAGYRF